MQNKDYIMSYIRKKDDSPLSETQQRLIGCRIEDVIFGKCAIFYPFDQRGVITSEIIWYELTESRLFIETKNTYYYLNKAYLFQNNPEGLADDQKHALTPIGNPVGEPFDKPFGGF